MLEWYKLPKFGVYFLILLIVLVLLPTIQSVGIGSFFKIELQKLSKEVEGLRQTILNINNTNVDIRTTSINYLGQELKADIRAESERLMNIGKSLIDQERHEESVEFLKKSVIIDSSNWISFMLLGFVFDNISQQNSLGMIESEMLAKSIFYSESAIDLDPNHYNQYMNLGLAQGHMGGINSWLLGIENLNKAALMLKKDKINSHKQQFKIAIGKCLSFIGDFRKRMGDHYSNMRDDFQGKTENQLDNYSQALKHRKEAVMVFDSCPEPNSNECIKWRDDAKNAINDLNKKLNKLA